MNGVSILGLIVVSVFALVCAGCNTAAKQAEGREILERYQQELDRLEKSAKELDDESQTFDEKVAATNKNDPDEHWSVMMLATGFDQVLREYKRDYELVKQKIDSEFEAAGLSQEVCDDVWSEYWEGRGVTADVQVLEKRLNVFAEKVSVTSRQLDDMVCRGIYRWMEPNWPKGASRTYKHEMECSPRTIERRLGGVRFRLAAPTKFTMRYGDNHVVPVTQTFDIILEQQLVLEGQPLKFGTTVHRSPDGTWTPNNQ